ncbi:serine/threonine-protein kinase [Kitasatospora sp. NPDC088134]|uniref:serine/threonine-protein kinase n=1 Tax=Kitasatospora sp. NPDC088134 TaxID=3364071 RepID=UPI003812D83A
MVTEVFRFQELRPQDPEQLGRFRVAARLGEGGMGRVFLALSPGGQFAAVKVVREELARDAEFGDRFAREIAAAQKVRGAHLAPLLDADPHGGQPWLATAYVAGPSLHDLVVRNGPLPTGQVLLLGWGIAHALGDIHAAQVVHRDLKPANIVLDESGPKVIDFGIVKSLTESAVQHSQSTRVGTPAYMSPEQATGRTVGPASDVFALASTLYRLATGRDAFAAENQWAVAHRIVADDPDLADLDAPLRALLADCFAKDPGHRPTPAEVRARCEELLGGPPGPGAWMDVTGGLTAVQERTAALRALVIGADGEEDEEDEEYEEYGGQGAEEAEAESGAPVTGSTVLLPRPAGTRPMDARPPKAPNGGRWSAALARFDVEDPVAVVAFTGLVGPLVAALVPFMTERWRVRKTGHEVGAVTESFDWHHPWQAVSSGVQGVSTDSVVVGAGVIGTALAALLLLIGLRTAPRHPVLRGVRTVGALLLTVWFAAVLLVGGMLLVMTCGLWTTDDNPLYEVRSTLQGGGTLILMVNLLLFLNRRAAPAKRPV